MNTCRFCHQFGKDRFGLNLLQYGVRHYAHPDCLLRAKGCDAWTLLPDWRLETFPYFAAKRAGLDVTLEEAIRGRKEHTNVR